MVQLISEADFTNFRELTSNLEYSERLYPYILQAQNFDLKDLLGNELYTDILDNISSYATLLDGGEYTINGKTYSFSGVRAALVMFTYARFIKNQNINVTRFGVVYKNNSDTSERVDTKTLEWASSNAREQGMAYWSECVEYIKSDATLLNKYRCNKTTKTPVRISAAG